VSREPLPLAKQIGTPLSRTLLFTPPAMRVRATSWYSRDADTLAISPLFADCFSIVDTPVRSKKGR
jgi:hypothetical protein